MLLNSKILLECFAFKMFQSHQLYITVAVVIYIGQSPQYCSYLGMFYPKVSYIFTLTGVLLNFRCHKILWVFG